MNFEDVEERDGACSAFFSGLLNLTFGRHSLVMERMAVITNRGDEDGGPDINALYAFEDQGRPTACFV